METANDERLYIRQVAQANSHYLITLLANMLNSLILAYVLWDVVSLSRLAVWLVVLAVVVVPRAVYAHGVQLETLSQARKTGRIYTYGLAFTGLAWGLASLLLFPENSLPHQTFLAFVVGGMVIGSSVTSAALDNTFLAFSIPALAPLTVRFFAVGSEISNAMGLMLLIFFFCATIIARKLHAMIARTINSNLELDREIEIRKKAENELRGHQENLEDTISRKTRALEEANAALLEQMKQRELTERKYQEIFNSTNDAIFIHEAASGRIVEVNQAMLDMYGMTREEVPSLTPEDLSEGSPPYSAAEAMEYIKAAKERGPQIFEWRARRKNGDIFWVEVCLTYTESETGQFIIAVVRDIEARKKVEENLIKVKKLESIGILAGGIAHDFNNILMAITGNINLALFDQNLNPETKRLLNEAEKASIRARDLTHQLLTFSKGGEPVRKTSSLKEVIEDSAGFVLHGRNSSCTFDIPDDLYLVDIDRGQISQVIQNIVLNADQAMPNGGTIRITCDNAELPDQNKANGADKKYVRIRIADAGMGIDSSHLDKIFDPYFSTRSSGNGLGLAICQSIVSKHQGSITVDSKPGAGSTFTILLPASTRRQIIKDASASMPDQGVDSRKIMIVDDEEQVRNITQAMLGKLGFDVVTAREGKEGVRLYADALRSEHPIDLVIMDLTIPGGMGGKEAAAKILDVHPDAKIIVASGYSNDPVMANYKDYGFCAAVEKPFLMDDIKKSILSQFQ